MLYSSLVTNMRREENMADTKKKKRKSKKQAKNYWYNMDGIYILHVIKNR